MVHNPQHFDDVWEGITESTRKSHKFRFPHQDPEHVDLVKRSVKKLERLAPEGRAKDNILSQQDWWFHKAMAENIGSSPEALEKAILADETLLRNVSKPVPGAKAHHGYALSGRRILSRLPIKEQLQIGSIVGTRGYRGGTNPFGLVNLSNYAHNKVAHLNPWRVLADKNTFTDFKMYSRDNPKLRMGDRINSPLDPGLPLDEIINQYEERILKPQKWLRDAAIATDRPVREALKKITGTDNFAQLNLSLRKSTHDLYKYLGVDFSELADNSRLGLGLYLPKGKGKVVTINQAKRLGRQFQFDEAGWANYNLGLGSAGSKQFMNFISKNIVGELAGAGLDPNVHKFLAKGEYEKAAETGVVGAIAGGATQHLIRSLPAKLGGVAVRALAPKLAIIAAPLIAEQIADAYLIEHTGKSVRQHIAKASQKTGGAVREAITAVVSGSYPTGISSNLKPKNPERAAANQAAFDKAIEDWKAIMNPKTWLK